MGDYDDSHYIGGNLLPLIRSEWFGRTLFVRNLPPTFTKNDVQILMKSFKIDQSAVHYLFRR